VAVDLCPFFATKKTWVKDWIIDVCVLGKISCRIQMTSVAICSWLSKGDRAEHGNSAPIRHTAKACTTNCIATMVTRMKNAILTAVVYKDKAQIQNIKSCKPQKRTPPTSRRRQRQQKRLSRHGHKNHLSHGSTRLEPKWLRTTGGNSVKKSCVMRSVCELVWFLGFSPRTFSKQELTVFQEENI
jgi:hypothetical protein